MDLNSLHLFHTMSVFPSNVKIMDSRINYIDGGAHIKQYTYRRTGNIDNVLNSSGMTINSCYNGDNGPSMPGAYPSQWFDSRPTDARNHPPSNNRYNNTLPMSQSRTPNVRQDEHVQILPNGMKISARNATIVAMSEECRVMHEQFMEDIFINDKRTPEEIQRDMERDQAQLLREGVSFAPGRTMTWPSFRK